MLLDVKPFLDLPKPLGRIVTEHRIAAGTAIAYSVTAGQYVQIIDVEGSQCSDFLAFAGADWGEEIDGTVTRTLNGLALPQAGLLGKYFSQTMQPLFEVMQDTCGRHDSFMLACTAKYYEDAGYPGHPSCSDNFNSILQSYGILDRPGWAAINFFFNTEVDGTGSIASGEAWSRPGDYVLLRASQDLLCASSACPDDIDAANGWNPTPIHVRIYDATETFVRAIGRRTAADAPVRLTQESAFTGQIRSLTDDITEYNGFWVPNCFAHLGVHAEYWALRERAALMDLSALRKFQITGADALNLLQLAFSRDVAKLAIGQSVYGCLLNPHGGMIDDGIVFRLDEQQFRYVGNCDNDRAWLEKVAQQHEFQVTVRPIDLHNLALQGPLSREILRSIAEFDVDALTYFRFTTGHVAKIPVLVSRTGYTGELGYELFVEPSRGAELWDAIMQAGRSAGIAPLGMLALDRARIEAGLLAAGREFDDLTSPYQAGIGWAVALKKPNFIGKAALEQIKLRPPKVAVGLVLEGNEVVSGGECLHPSGDTVPGARSDRWRVGAVTSGTFSPILNRSIALAQVVPEFASPGTVLEVGLMDGMKRRIRAIVGTLAAYDPTKSRVKS